MTTFETSFTQSTASKDNNTSLAQLLHTADKLSTLFNSHHASSFSYVLSISSSYNQLQNLLNLPSLPSTRSRPEGGIRERGMVKVQETIEVSKQLNYIQVKIPKRKLTYHTI